MEQQKARVMRAVDDLSEELLQLSHTLHAHPEISFEEYRLVETIRQMLTRHGFAVKTGVAGLDTAFIAGKTGKPGGPHIAFLAEYDALPQVGHGCGHNIIAACSVGAAIALCSVLDHYAGKVSIIGTPAEEGGGGKVIMLNAGVFDDVDFALMIHPTEGPSLVARGARAARTVSVEFFGKAAHSSIPADGINALSAALSTFDNIERLRPTFDYRDNVNGVILQGGVAPNIIADYANCRFSLRSHTLIRLEKLTERVVHCANCAATLTGARVKTDPSPAYSERYPNLPMGAAFKANMAQLGEEMIYADPNGLYASSDVGNVTIRLPAIHEYLTIGPENVPAHTAEFARRAISPRGDEVCIKGAKGLAMTGFDLLSDPALQKAAKEAHEKQVPKEYQK